MIHIVALFVVNSLRFEKKMLCFIVKILISSNLGSIWLREESEKRETYEEECEKRKINEKQM